MILTSREDNNEKSVQTEENIMVTKQAAIVTLVLTAIIALIVGCSLTTALVASYDETATTESSETCISSMVTVWGYDYQVEKMECGNTADIRYTVESEYVCVTSGNSGNCDTVTTVTPYFVETAITYTTYP